jgi:hypothetical protein
VIRPWSYQAFRHSLASIVASLRALRSGAMSFLALLKVGSHSAAIAVIDRVSKAHK